MTYEAWRISYQSSEQAARAAYEECAQLRAKIEAAEKDRSNFLVEMGKLCAQCDALRAKVEAMEKRLRLILEEPENTMSNSKAMREMIRQARLALEESK